MKAKSEYLLGYITEFLRNSNAGHKRLMLKILEKCDTPDIFGKLSFSFKLDLLIDLKEFPKALYILESAIRTRISLEKCRYSPNLLNNNELEWCRKIYKQLLVHKYINAIPVIFNKKYAITDTKKTIKSIFDSGNYFILTSWIYKDTINPYIFGAA